MEYWHQSSPDKPGTWDKKPPPVTQTHVPVLVHESSTLPLGDIKNSDDVLVDSLDYKLKGTKNVYITGGALWPRAGSWNPTLTMVALAADLAEQLAAPAGDGAAAAAGRS